MAEYDIQSTIFKSPTSNAGYLLNNVIKTKTIFSQKTGHFAKK